MKTGQFICEYNETVSLRVKKNPYLLQKEEENISEETNDDADVNAEENKVDDKKRTCLLQ